MFQVGRETSKRVSNSHTFTYYYSVQYSIAIYIISYYQQKETHEQIVYFQVYGLFAKKFIFSAVTYLVSFDRVYGE